MSEPGAAPVAAAAASEASAGSVAVAPSRLPRAPQPLRAFCLDVVLALAILFSLSLLGGAAWAIGHAVMRQLSGHAPDPVRAMQPGGLAILAIAAVSTAAAALVLYLWRRRASAAERRASAVQARRPSTWGWVALAGVVAWLASTALSWLASALGQPLQPSNLSVLADVAQQRPWLLLAFAVLVAPLYEELLFRRVLFGRLWAAGRPLLGAVLSALLFALLHELPRRGVPLQDTLMLWIDYGFMGLVFAWVYRRTGTLWAAIGAHALNNLLAGLALLAGIGH